MSLYTAIVAAIRDHWKAHDGKYPQRVQLSSVDHAELMRDRKIVTDHWGSTITDINSMLGVKIVEEPAGPSALVSVDGSLVPLSNK